MLQATLLSSCWNSYKYLDQYLFGLSQLKSISDKVSLTLAFGSVSDTYTDEDHQNIKSQVEKTCSEAGISLHFYVGKKEENFYQTVNLLVAQTIGFTENYAQLNLDDLRFSENLLAQIEALQTNLIVYSDFLCTNDVVKCYQDYRAGVSMKAEETWPDVDMTNKEKYYREFKWSCFTTIKAQVFARIGVWDEQMTCASDYDFINRCLFFGIKPHKVPGISGIFMANGTGLSTKPNTAGVKDGYFVLQRFLGNKHCCIVNYGRKVLFRNL